jgi:O-antigen/teichoic acid export membrane protein
MLLNLLVSLYTSRVILNALGVEDYGIYNVVGGVVTLFAFLSGTMSTAVQRFLSFEIGKGDVEKLKRTFGSSNVLMLALGIVVVLCVETIGLWLLDNKLVIPEYRMFAAKSMFQIVTFSLFVSIMSVPYNALLIAKERMSVFAYIGISDVLLRLAVAFITKFSPVDKLITYALLLFGITLLIRAIYITYCKRHFDESKGKTFSYDKEIGKQMFGFFSWNTIGAFSYVAKEQGVNIVLNMFSGLTINAARGITSQVSGALYGFISNFQVAINPQITKNYAVGDYQALKDIVYRGAKFSFFLFFFLALPVFIDAPYILSLWLNLVPDHTISFIRLTIILMSIECLAYPIISSLLATGNVMKYQIIVGTLLILNLPLSYFALKLKFPPESTLIIAILISLLSLAIRLILARNQLGFSIWSYSKDVLLKVLIVVVLSFVCPFLLYRSLVIDEFLKLLILCLVSWTISGAFILLIGMSKSERVVFKSYLNKFLKK